MFNLIWKDLVLQKKGVMILLPALFGYIVFNPSYIWIGIVFSIVIIQDVFAKDEHSSINKLLNSLPYTRQEIVTSKYIGAIIFTLLVALTMIIGGMLIHKEIPTWKEIMLMVSLSMLAVSFIFPFSYKFKSQYILKAFLVLFVVYMIVITIFIHNLNDILREFVQTILTLEDPSVFLVMILSIMVLYIFSWLLSIRIYRNKVF
ncbi:ABC-2 transporter permease [Gracilibacillus lacisalsi]|uniref:ABC-2 transporter permease n=1 Tax=Gracilibacillus lacisalsi TaxID=393087 RepID=UPI0003756344|nr:ABC-2 transporter permease [Gracilibacillus lacisalsi]